MTFSLRDDEADARMAVTNSRFHIRKWIVAARQHLASFRKCWPHEDREPMKLDIQRVQ